MSGGTAGVRGTGAECRKFAPNIFNKSKCSSCFKQKEEHSAEALECNRVSFAWWTLYLSLFLSFSPLRVSFSLSRMFSLSLSLSLSSSFFFFIFIFRSLRIYLRLSLTRAYSVHLEPAFCLSCSLTNFLVRSGPGRRTKVLLVLCKMNACTMNAISPRNERFSADTVPTSLFSFRHVQIAVRFSWNCTIHVRTWRFVGDYLAIRFHLCYYIRSTYENTILNLFLF